MCVARDHAGTHADDEGDEVRRAQQSIWFWLRLPTESLWLKPIEMPGRHVQWELTHREMLETKQTLAVDTQEPFHRSHQCIEKILSVIGSKAKMYERSLKKAQ